MIRISCTFADLKMYFSDQKIRFQSKKNVTLKFKQKILFYFGEIFKPTAMVNTKTYFHGLCGANIAMEKDFFPLLPSIARRYLFAFEPSFISIKCDINMKFPSKYSAEYIEWAHLAI